MKKILVADDDRAITKLLNNLLVTQGYLVSVAYDGLETMVKVKKSKPDLIILDIMMPEVNGYDVCSNIKFEESLKHIPIIMLTSRAQELDPKIGQLMGIDYMKKPIDAKILLEKIETALKK